MNWEEEDYEEAELRIQSDSIDLSQVMVRPVVMNMDQKFMWLRCHLSSVLFLLPTDLVLEWRPGPDQSGMERMTRILRNTDTPRTVGMRNWTQKLEEIFCTNVSYIFTSRAN